jgi:pyridoxal 5'-phosphate synthase pdxT subunit
MRVGVLALQGDVPEHLSVLRTVSPGAVAVRTPSDLSDVGALFLPGGESTAIARLIEEAGLWKPLEERIREGLPILATCAGLILLAREIAPSAAGRDPPSFGALDVIVRRNDYGKQRESHEASVTVEGLKKPPFPGVFIRSPRIVAVGPQASAFAWREHEIVGVRAGPLWGLTFHPELSHDLRVHRLFLDSLGRRARR